MSAKMIGWTIGLLVACGLVILDNVFLNAVGLGFGLTSAGMTIGNYFEANK